MNFQVDYEQYKKILDLIESGKNQGATILCGGKSCGQQGYFIEPTIFVDVKEDMRIGKEDVC